MDPANLTFEQLVIDNRDAVYRMARAIVRDHSLAEDVAQDTLIKAWRGLPRFRGESSVRTWVLRICHNTALSMLRKRRDELLPTWELPDSARHSVEGSVEMRSAMEHFQAGLLALDADSRAMVVLRDIEGLSYDDIAIALDLPVTTVRTKLFRARRALATTLEEWR